MAKLAFTRQATRLAEALEFNMAVTTGNAFHPLCRRFMRYGSSEFGSWRARFYP
jgi:hypothetical protein